MPQLKLNLGVTPSQAKPKPKREVVKVTTCGKTKTQAALNATMERNAKAATQAGLALGITDGIEDYETEILDALDAGRSVDWITKRYTQAFGITELEVLEFIRSVDSSNEEVNKRINKITAPKPKHKPAPKPKPKTDRERFTAEYDRMTERQKAEYRFGKDRTVRTGSSVRVLNRIALYECGHALNGGGTRREAVDAAEWQSEFPNTGNRAGTVVSTSYNNQDHSQGPKKGAKIMIGTQATLELQSTNAPANPKAKAKRKAKRRYTGGGIQEHMQLKEPGGG